MSEQRPPRPTVDPGARRSKTAAPRAGAPLGTPPQGARAKPASPPAPDAVRARRQPGAAGPKASEAARGPRSTEAPREQRSDRARRAVGPAGSGTRLTKAQQDEIAARYDPRRERRRQEARVDLPEDVDPQMLDPQVRTELRSLAKDTSDLVARHLVMAGRLLDDDPAGALRHARAARAMAGRVGVVREAAGLAAYHAGEWADALSELRAARRITGRADHLPVMADCERALGRPEKALAYGDDSAVAGLSQDIKVELVIVLAGARRDLGQAEAAILLLQEPARRTVARRPWAARLWYAYADALEAAGRHEQARTWLEKAANADELGETDADERLLELEGFAVTDAQVEDDGQDPA